MKIRLTPIWLQYTTFLVRLKIKAHFAKQIQSTLYQTQCIYIGAF
jgi:hypothetical protein